MSRTEESLKNIITSLLIQIGTVFLNFVSRTVLIKTMGEQYLGINGVFGNILSMLSLAELGIGTTISYWLYEPMAKNDTHKLSVLMCIYKKIYNTIGITVLLLGLLITPFLELFMKEIPDIPYLKLIFILYVVNSSITYFFVYKGTLINVAQKNYIVATIEFVVFTVTSILQIVILLKFRNYVLYFACSVISVLI